MAEASTMQVFCLVGELGWFLLLVAMLLAVLSAVLLALLLKSRPEALSSSEIGWS